MIPRISPLRIHGSANAEQQELLRSLQQAQADLSHAHLAFDNAVDPELVESSIFEIRALQARINYLLRRLKAAEEACAAAVEEGRKKWI